MHILLSNDDGYDSKGIRILAHQLALIAKTTIVAPTTNRSGASNSLTLDRPLRLKQFPNYVYAVDGTPTDCVHLGITGLLEDNPPDMVVAGINAGHNLGDDVLYSGTVAAATEGRFLGFPAVAFSLAGKGAGKGDSGVVENWDCAAHIAAAIIKHLIAKPFGISTSIILNINIPDVPYDEIAGIQATRLGSRHKAEPVTKDKDPQGEEVYWVGPAGPEQDAGPGTDFYAVRNSYVSITPMHVDLTHHGSVETLEGWLGGLDT